MKFIEIIDCDTYEKKSINTDKIVSVEQNKEKYCTAIVLIDGRIVYTKENVAEVRKKIKEAK